MVDEPLTAHETQGGKHAEMQRISADVITVTHPQWITRRLDERLNATTIRRIQSCERLRDRLTSLLVDAALAQAVNAGIIPRAEDPLSEQRNNIRQSDGRSDLTKIAARLQGLTPTEIVSRAGAAWHGRSLRLLIAGKIVMRLTGHIGEQAHAFGLRQNISRDDVPIITNVDELASAIKRDGIRCVATWTAMLPHYEQYRIRLRFSPDAFPDIHNDDDIAHREDAQMIMLRIAEELEGAPCGTT